MNLISIEKEDKGDQEEEVGMKEQRTAASTEHLQDERTETGGVWAPEASVSFTTLSVGRLYNVEWQMINE
jgi:hypothetical protein